MENTKRMGDHQRVGCKEGNGRDGGGGGCGGGRRGRGRGGGLTGV